jgi:phosphoglycerate dehydrogenase-like enzyme
LNVKFCLAQNKRCQTLAELLKQSDCISLHASLNESTYHIINDASLKHVKPGGNVFVVNAAHSGLVDDVALANALKSGTIRAAALDKFNADALNPHTGVFRDLLNNSSSPLIISPGVAYYSDASAKEMREQAAYEVRRGLLAAAKTSGLVQGLRNCVNRDLLAVVAASSSSSLSNGTSMSSSHHSMQLMMHNISNNGSSFCFNEDK